MKSLDYKKLFLKKGIVPIDYFTKEVDRLLSYHSYSPQYKFYSDLLIGGLDYCIYEELIDTESAKGLIKKIENHRDTCSSGITASIMFLFDRYKPRLGTIDLLFDIDLDRTYFLKLLCDRMLMSLSVYDSFGEMYGRRRQLILDNLQNALSTKDNPNRECYYHLFFAKRLLIVNSCYYRNGECDDLMEVYLEIAREVYKVDSVFYKNYVSLFSCASDDCDPSIIFSDKIVSFGDNAGVDMNLIGSSSVFSSIDKNSNQPSKEIDNKEEYSYIDFLIDLDCFLRDLSSYKYLPNINKYVKRVYESNLPQVLKDKFSTQLYNLEIDFSSESFEITEPFLWFDFVGEDFPNFLKLKCYNESKVVVSTIANLITEDNLVEFYVNKAYMYAFANGETDVYNYVLRDNLENLKTYNFIKDVDYYYEKHRR